MQRFFDLFIVPLFIIWIIGQSILELKDAFNVNGTLDSIVILVKAFLIATFLFISRPSKVYKINVLSVLGITLSYLAPFGLESTGFNLSKTSFILFLFNFFLFNIFLLYSYIILGRSLSVVPAYKKIIKNGPYLFMAHPIYSMYSHLMINYLLFFYSHRNLVCTILFILGLLFRAREEERLLLASSDYQIYRKNKKGFFSWYLTPLLLISLSHFIKNSIYVSPPSNIKVYISYPAYSLNPLFYDDWGAVFIGNHIYHTFFPNELHDKHYIAQSFRTACQDYNSKGKCRIEKILFNLNEFTSCDNTYYNKGDILNELKLILAKKNWIIKDYKFCSSKKYDVCIEYPAQKDIKRKLENIYFRFGWSKSNPQSKIYGSGPYCLHSLESTKIQTGSLISKSSKFPKIILLDNKNKNDADISLYNDKEIDLTSLQLNTPLFYYLVNNPKKTIHFPWADRESLSLIQNFLIKKKLIYNNFTSIDNIAPKGNILNKSYPSSSMNQKFHLALPEYIDKCQYLRNMLEDLWKAKGYKNAKAECLNTSMYIEDIMQSYSEEWDAFITPLSPGASGRNSLYDQYFYKNSNDSWLKTDFPLNHLHLLGVGQTFIGINKEIICSVKDNSLGLSRILITDFEFCH